MQIYVLDDNCQVVFTFEDGNSEDYKVNLSKSEQVAVVRTVSEALRFLLGVKKRRH